MTIRRTLSSRRSFLSLAGAGASALALAGCGFKLREAPIFAFKTIAVPGRSAYVSQLRRALTVTGTVTVLPDAELEHAEVVFDMLGERRDRVVLSTNAAGQVREMQLLLNIRFRLRTPAGKEVLGPSEISQSRDITYNETNALAKEGEEKLLYNDMTTDIVQQTLRRLGAVKSL